MIVKDDTDTDGREAVCTPPYFDVHHPEAGSHALTGQAVVLGVLGFVSLPFLPGGPLARFRLDAGHSPQTTRLGLSFQALDPPLQLGDGILLLGNDRQQDFGRSDRGLYPCRMFAMTANLLAFARSSTFEQFPSPSLHCYYLEII